MILLPLLLQVAAPMAPAAATASATSSSVDKLKPIDQARAIETFRTLCWQVFRGAEAFHAAVAGAAKPLAEVPPVADAGQAAEVYRSDEALLSYLASDMLAANVPSRQCRLRVRLAGAADQLAIAARIGDALKLPSGKTSTDPTGSETTWDVAQPDGRIVRLIAATRNAARGGSEFRLTALLLAPR
jgi:hypothetical protein